MLCLFALIEFPVELTGLRGGICSERNRCRFSIDPSAQTGGPEKAVTLELANDLRRRGSCPRFSDIKGQGQFDRSVSIHFALLTHLIGHLSFGRFGVHDSTRLVSDPHSCV